MTTTITVSPETLETIAMSVMTRTQFSKMYGKPRKRKPKRKKK